LPPAKKTVSAFGETEGAFKSAGGGGGISSVDYCHSRGVRHQR
jgi:hypothetical protein